MPSTPLTDAELAEIEKRTREARTGPWEITVADRDRAVLLAEVKRLRAECESWKLSDAELVADNAELEAELATSRTANQKLRDYCSNLNADRRLHKTRWQALREWVTKADEYWGDSLQNELLAEMDRLEAGI